ncbi:Aste57867_22611 [Aphanomyces stellatus]|uniref:Aste57867_22611 protein n=1 Tax=Aphanomyces stellatus TaxID=120398 RepID=A0A485LL69_9STRA|nr:hypothetical protein As57867_022541 [Aphanomyces stellatus]VFT99268.1 Aste57867_22611 [Aphanomyces stellatus]
MSETPRAKMHALRPAAGTPTSTIARPPSLDGDPLMRPVLQSKKDSLRLTASPRRPSKPGMLEKQPTLILPEIYDAVKPDSRGESIDVGDPLTPRRSNQVTRPRSNGPDAGDVIARPPLASDLYFELQRQQELGIAPTAGASSPSPRMQRHLYHDKMQQKYQEMRVLRTRIKHLEVELAATRQQTTVTATQGEGTTGNDDGGPVVVEAETSPAKPKSTEEAEAATAAARARVLRLERHLTAAKEEIAELNEQLGVARLNDKAQIDTLVAKLELERTTNKVLGERVFDVDIALKACVAKLAEAESALAKERQERDLVINQLTTMSRQAISDHRRRAVTSKVKGVVSTMGKGTLQTKLDAANQRLVELEGAMKQVQMEALTWRKEAMHKAAMLTEYGVLGHATTATSATALVVSKLLDLNCRPPASSPDLVLHGARVVDGVPLLLHVARTLDPFALHVVAYDGPTAQEDSVSFFADDITRLVCDGDKYLLQPTDAHVVAELVDLLVETLAVGYKNGTFFLVERAGTTLPLPANDADSTTRVCIYRGSARLPGDCAAPVSLVVNELYRTAFAASWSLEILAVAIDDDGEPLEWCCRLSMDQVGLACPHFLSCAPHDATHTTLDHRIDANDLLLQPLLRTLAIQQNTLVSSLSAVPRAPPPLVLQGSAAPAVATSILAATTTALTHRSLVTIRGLTYYLTLRERWDARVLVDVSLVDAVGDRHVDATFDDAMLATLVRCADAMLLAPTQASFVQGIQVDVRPTLVDCFRRALDVVDGVVVLSFAALARRRVAVQPQTQLVALPVAGSDSTTRDVELLGDVDEEAAPAALANRRLAHVVRGLRLRDRSFGLVRVCRTRPPAAATVDVVTCMRVGGAVVSTLLVDNRLPLDFVLELWAPPL